MSAAHIGQWWIGASRWDEWITPAIEVWGLGGTRGIGFRVGPFCLWLEHRNGWPQ